MRNLTILVCISFMLCALCSFDAAKSFEDKEKKLQTGLQLKQDMCILTQSSAGNGENPDEFIAQTEAELQAYYSFVTKIETAHRIAYRLANYAATDTVLSKDGLSPETLNIIARKIMCKKEIFGTAMIQAKVSMIYGESPVKMIYDIYSTEYSRGIQYDEFAELFRQYLNELGVK